MTGLRQEDVVPSPNIWHWPHLYEVENRAQDTAGALWSALRVAYDWTGRDVVDVGCGSGYHLCTFAADAATVLGVEPHAPLLAMARERVNGLVNVRVVGGSAQNLPLPDASVDLIHARTAYFFGQGCEPGLVEADRVLRPGGVLAVIDLDATQSPYGAWLCADVPNYDPVAVEAFFASNGFVSQSIATTWRFAKRADLEAVIRIEFSPAVAEQAIAEITDVTIPVGYRLRIRRKPEGLILP